MATIVGVVAPIMAPTAAYAGSIPCPPGVLGVAPEQPQGVGTDGVVPIHTLYLTTISATPTFNVSDSRVAINNLSSPIMATFTSQQSRTFTITVSAGVSIGVLYKYLTVKVDASIQQSRTTAIGVATTATVPAFSTVRGDYGVQAWDVYYNAQKIMILAQKCYDEGTTTGFTNAPTSVEGWRMSLA